MVWGEPYAPHLVVDEEGEVREPIGIYLHRDEDVVVYRDDAGKIRNAPDDCVSVVRWHDYEGEW